MSQQLKTRSFNRRAFIRTGLSAAAVAGVASRSHFGSTTSHAPGVRLASFNTPAHSQSVVKHFGMNIQPGNNNEYANYDKVTSLLQDLGVRKVRSIVRTGDPNGAMPFLASLHTSLGITVHGTAGDFPHTDAERAAMPKMRTAMAAAITKYAGMYDSLGGYNEPNGTRFGPRPSWWLTETLTHQKWMWGLIHGGTTNSALQQILVCGPSLHDQVKTLQQDYLDCSVLKPYMERINMHRYPAGMVPSNLIDERTKWATAGVGVMPVVISETSYNNGMNSNCYAPVPADIIAVYADRLLMEHVSRGDDMYWFELLNNYPPSSTDLQDFYGLVSVPSQDPSTWQPMPAYQTYKRLLGLMKDGDAPYSPAPLSLTISGANDVKSYLVGKRDGSYLLALWRDVKLWDRTTRSRLNPPAATAVVTFPAAKTVTVYMPSIRDAAYSTTVASQHSVSLSGNLTLLQIAA
jgi:hypothetical protein